MKAKFEFVKFRCNRISSNNATSPTVVSKTRLTSSPSRFSRSSSTPPINLLSIMNLLWYKSNKLWNSPHRLSKYRLNPIHSLNFPHLQSKKKEGSAVMWSSQIVRKLSMLRVRGKFKAEGRNGRLGVETGRTRTQCAKLKVTVWAGKWARKYPRQAASVSHFNLKKTLRLGRIVAALPLERRRQSWSIISTCSWTAMTLTYHSNFSKPLTNRKLCLNNSNLWI